MTDYEYAQAVMKAAGVEKVQTNLYARCQDLRKMHECGGACAVVDCSCQGYVASYHYPDPLTSGDAFLALIEALRGRGLWVLVTISDSNGSGYRVEIRRGFHGDGPYAWADTFQAALVEAAGKALGVTR